MKRLAAVLLGLVATSAAALPVTATWTGKQERVQTVTYQWKLKCEYFYAGQYYYFLFDLSCPFTVQIE